MCWCVGVLVERRAVCVKTVLARRACFDTWMFGCYFRSRIWRRQASIDQWECGLFAADILY